jgi:hypothetical protein
VQVPVDALHSIGAGTDDYYAVRDLLDDTTYLWRGEWNYVRFDPAIRQGHVLKVEGRR